ncbi:hypothetical protein CQ14_40630 [Bradyrhizobium lablabi]|uniref:Uncharacterized protein n=1 Tax=Bradyrhizobium lablabi TaxID=722472 RepID=A0A0R3NE32_9BRAD|nr:hypothetical protein CQ14_40630 [Bradyrhizobium lablabi]
MRPSTGLAFARFLIGILLGLVAEFTHGAVARMMLPSFAARWMDRKRIVAVGSSMDLRSEDMVLTLNL